MANVVKWIRRPGMKFSGNPDTEEHTEQYLAIMDGLSVMPKVDIVNSQYCPSYLERHPLYALYMVVDIQIEESKEVEQAFEVFVKYSNKYGTDGTTRPDFTWIQNPLERPAVVQWGTYQTREPVEYAYDDNEEANVPVITAAGEPLLMEDEVDRTVISISKNVPKISSIFGKQCNFINKDSVRIGGLQFDAETLWLRGRTISTLQIENNVQYYVLEYKLYHKEETWRTKLRHAGFYYRETLPGGQMGRTLPILVGDTFPTNPVPLMTNGGLSVKMAKYIGMIKSTAAERAALFTAAELKQVWKDATLTFRSKKRITFTGNVYLK